jgi:hypothetical protein
MRNGILLISAPKELQRDLPRVSQHIHSTSSGVLPHISAKVCVCMYVCMYMCVCERDRETVSECVCTCERACVCVRVILRVFVYTLIHENMRIYQKAKYILNYFESDVGRTENYVWYKQCASLIIFTFFSPPYFLTLIDHGSVYIA